MTAIRTRSDGRIVTTIPAGKASTLDLAGRPITWHVQSRERVRLSPAADDAPKTSTVQYNDAAAQYTVSIWTGLAHAMDMVGGELTDWTIEHGSLYATVETTGDGR